MNRAFLIVLIPAVLIAAAYLGVAVYLHAPLKVSRFLAAGGGFLLAVGIVYVYRRRKPRPPGS